MRTETPAELNSYYATYFPDSQIITVAPMIDLGGGGEVGGGGLSARYTSYLFHEWLHYIHNVSTVHGIGAFAVMAEVWSAFRHTTNQNGEGLGPPLAEGWSKFQVGTLFSLMAIARNPAGAKLPRDAKPENVRVTTYLPVKADEMGEVTHFHLTFEVSNYEGEATSISSIFGAVQVLESVAYLLEKRFLFTLTQEQSEVPAVLPYHALQLLAGCIAPSLTEEEILLCGLASLQSSFVAVGAEELLKKMESVSSTGRRAWLAEWAKSQLTAGKENLDGWLNRLEGMFPHDEPMARAVKETLEFMRRNINHRLQDPFFELEMISQLHRGGVDNFSKNMDMLMLRHGICGVRQENVGGEDEIGRDHIYDFAVMAKDPMTSEGRRILLASFDYVLRHIAFEDFRSTVQARVRKCPFFTSCTEPFRHSNPDDCYRTPWKSVEVTTNPCWYAHGVMKVRPGPAAQA